MSAINYGQLIDWADEFKEDYNLTNGNAETFEQDGEIYVSIEGSRHTTIGFWLSKDDLARVDGSKSDFNELLKDRVSVRVDEFDVNEEFDEYWSADFGRQNGFTARDFLDLLDADRVFFLDAISKF